MKANMACIDKLKRARAEARTEARDEDEADKGEEDMIGQMLTTPCHACQSLAACIKT